MSGNPIAFQADAFQNDAFQTGDISSVVSPSGGWTRGNYAFLDYHARRDALRREERDLALKSRQRKTIRKATERIAGGLAEDIPPATAQSDMVAAIVASDAYQAAVNALAVKDVARRQAIADYVMRVILMRIMELREEDDAIAVFLLMGD